MGVMIEVLNCHRNKIISKLIRFATKSKYSHSAFKFDLQGTSFVVEAQKKGVYIISFTEWQKKYKYKFDSIEIFGNPYKIKKEALSYCGATNYDFFSLNVAHPIKILTGIWIGPKGLKAKKKMTCSEFIATVLKYEGAHDMTPDELYKILKS
jgi:hypothetical protein